MATVRTRPPSLPVAAGIAAGIAAGVAAGFAVDPRARRLGTIGGRLTILLDAVSLAIAVRRGHRPAAARTSRSFLAVRAVSVAHEPLG